MSLISQGRAPTWSQVGSPDADRGGFGVNRGAAGRRQKAHGWNKRQPWLPTLAKRRQGATANGPGGAYIAVLAMCAMTVPTICTQSGEARVWGFGETE